MSGARNKHEMRIGDFRRAVHEGDVFYETACMCENSFNPSEGKFEFLLPYTVNLSFACEVYMKAIMIHFSKEKAFSTGHRLGELFGKLNVDAQKIVREMFEQALKPWNKKLEKFLAEHDNIFMDFRYTFQDTDKEGLSVHLTDLGTFANCLKDYCHDLEGEVKNEQA